MVHSGHGITGPMSNTQALKQTENYQATQQKARIKRLSVHKSHCILTVQVDFEV